MLVFGDPVDSNTILSTKIPSLYLSPDVVPKLQIHILLPKLGCLIILTQLV